jgi:hypothetical protein
LPDSDDFLDELNAWVGQQGDVPQDVRDRRLPSPTFDPVRHRLETERNLAYVTIGALVGFLLLDFIASAAGIGNRVDGFMRIALPILAGLAGTAFGYYFGKK